MRGEKRGRGGEGGRGERDDEDTGWRGEGEMLGGEGFRVVTSLLTLYKCPTSWSSQVIRKKES